MDTSDEYDTIAVGDGDGADLHSVVEKTCMLMDRVGLETAEVVSMVDVSDEDQRLNCPLAPKLGAGDEQYARLWYDMQDASCRVSEVHASLQGAIDYVDLIHNVVVRSADDMVLCAGNAISHARNLFGVPDGRIVLPSSLQTVSMGAQLVLFRLQSELTNHGTHFQLQSQTEAGAGIVEDSDANRAAHAEMSEKIEAANKKLRETMNMIDVAGNTLKCVAEMMNVMNPSWRTRMVDPTVFVRSLMLANQGGTDSPMANILMHIVYSAHSQGLVKSDGILWGHIIHNGVRTGALERKYTLEKFVSEIMTMDNPAKWMVMMSAKIPNSALVREIKAGHTAMMPEMKTGWGRYAFIGGTMDLIHFTFNFSNNNDPRVARLRQLRDYALFRVSNERIRVQDVSRKVRHDRDAAKRTIRRLRAHHKIDALEAEAVRLSDALQRSLLTIVIPDEHGADMSDDAIRHLAQYFHNDEAEARTFNAFLNVEHIGVLKEIGARVQAYADAVCVQQTAEAEMQTDPTYVEAFKVDKLGNTPVKETYLELKRLSSMLYVLENLFSSEPMMDCELFIECSEFPYTQFARFLIPMTDDGGRLRFRLDCFRTPWFDQVFNYQGVGADVLAFQHVFLGRSITPPKMRESWDLILNIYGLSSTGKTLVSTQHTATHRDQKRGIDRVARISAGMQDTFGLSDQLKEGDAAARLIEFPDVTHELTKALPKTLFLKLAENESIVAPKKFEQRAATCHPPHGIAFSNKKFPYPDTSGNVARRVAEVHMGRPVRSPRTDMKQRIASNRIGAFIKGAGYYRAVTFKHEGETFWRFCPEMFKQERQKLENCNDPVKAFFGEMEHEGMLTFGPTFHINLRELRTLSSTWTKSGRPRIRWNDTNLFASAFDVRKLRMVTKMADLNADDRAHIHEMNGAIVIGCKMGAPGGG